MNGSKLSLRLELCHTSVPEANVHMPPGRQKK